MKVVPPVKTARKTVSSKAQTTNCHVILTRSDYEQYIEMRKLLGYKRLYQVIKQSR